jgi:hypothetical protein
MMHRVMILALALLAPALSSEDLKTAAAEPNPVKRARLGLANGERTALKAGEACKGAEYEKCNELLTEVQESVELASKSLDQSGIDARRSPRHFKDAEVRSHKILRLVEPIRAYVHPDDLEHFDAVARRISQINGEFLAAVLGKKKKK